MAKLTRVTGKVFGSQASPTGDVDNGAYIGQFGSAQAGTYVGTDDVAMIQNLPAWEQGWIGACVEEDQLPPLPERTGVDKVLSYQECYLLQQGMPEWDSATTYYIDNFCSYNGIIYKSLTDINLNNQPDVSPDNWEVYGKISQYTKFAINKGNPDLLINNSNELAFDVDNNNPLTYTNIMGNTRTVNALNSIDVSNVADGTYKVVLSNTSNQPYLFGGTVYNQETEPLPDFQTKFTDYNFYVENNYIKLSEGSIVAFPDGLDTNGNPKFNYVSMSALSFTETSWGSGNAMPCVIYTGGNYGFYTYFENGWFNQTTQPTSAGLWYNPETNLIKESVDGTTWTTKTLSFPLGKAYFTSGTGFTSLIESYQTSSVVWLNPQEPYSAKEKNKNLGYTSWQDFNDTLLLDSSVTVSSGVISSLIQPTYNYNGIDLNQSSKTNRENITSFGIPIYNENNRIYITSSQTFTCTSNGYVNLLKGSAVTTNGQYINVNCNNSQILTIGSNAGNNTYGYQHEIIPVAKGDILTFTFSSTVNSSIYQVWYEKDRGEL